MFMVILNYNKIIFTRHLQGWLKFVKAVKLCLEPVVSEEQVEDIQKYLKEFSDYYER